MTMEEIYNKAGELLESKSAGTRKNYLLNISHFGISNKPTKKTVSEKIKEWRKNGLSERTIQSRITSLRFVLNNFPDEFEEGILDYVSNIKLKKVEDKITYASEEIAKDIIAQSDRRTALAIGLMYYAGLSLSEVANIKISDFRKDKNGRYALHIDRDIPIPDELERLFHRYVSYERSYVLSTWDKNQQGGDYLFVGKKGNLTKIPLERTVKEQCRECGYPNLSCKSFRHGAGIKLAKNIQTIKGIGSLLGHKSVNSSKKYLKITKPTLEGV